MWVLDHKEGWMLKNWCFWAAVLEKTLESLDCKEIKPVNPDGNQSWIFIRKTDAEVEAPILCPPDVKTLMLGKIEGRRRRGWHEMTGWHHQLNGHEFEQAVKDGEGEGSLVCCSPWGQSRMPLSNRTTAHTRRTPEWEALLLFSKVLPHPHLSPGRQIRLRIAYIFLSDSQHSLPLFSNYYIHFSTSWYNTTWICLHLSLISPTG